MSSVRTGFHDELQTIRKMIIQMGELTIQFINETTQVLIQQQSDRAKTIRTTEKMIDELYEKIDERCIKLIATQQPAAGDLRFIIVSIKVANELERIADYANNIAKKVQKHKLDELGVMEKPELVDKIVTMSNKAVGMLQDAIKSFESNDPDYIDSVILQEKTVNSLNKELFRELIVISKANIGTQESIFELHSCIRYLERVADRSTNILELIFYMVRGFRYTKPD